MSNNEISHSANTEILTAYLKDISQYPLLSEVEELELFTALKNGNKDARETLIHANLRLVVSVAKRYMDNGMELIDLIQEGNVGLFKAIDKFDISKNTRFSTYAVFWIKQSILQTISSKSRAIRFPIYITDAIVTYRKFNKSYYSENERLPEDETIAEALGWNIDKVIQIKELSTENKMVSLDAPVAFASDTDSQTFGSIIPCEDNVIEQVMKSSLTELIASSIECLNEREQKVINLRFGLLDGNPRKLQEIANELGNITRERVRQIETRALVKLRNNELLRLECS